MEKLKLEEIKEFSEKETLVKTWELSSKKKTDKGESVNKVSKITLTEQRLIISEGKYYRNSQNYKKTSFPLSSIKSTYVSIGRESEQNEMWPIILFGCLALLCYCVGAFIMPMVVFWGVFCLLLGVVLTAKTIFSFLASRENVSTSVVVRLEISGDSETKTIVNSCTSINGSSSSKASAIVLKFKVTPEAVDMAKEIDNLITETKIKKNLI